MAEELKISQEKLEDLFALAFAFALALALNAPKLTIAAIMAEIEMRWPKFDEARSPTLYA